MHSIELTRIQFKNLFSYGTNLNEVVLNNDGITWIKGPNGSGKSTIIEAITVALFGESYRKIPQKEMINAANTSKLWVRLEFYRRDARGDVQYTVERSLGRSGSMSFTIWVNGDLKDKEAGYSQKYFEDEILGFNRNLFENVISLNTIQSKPFIDMDAKEKRTLLESIISLHIDKIKKINSGEYTLASSKYDDAVGDVQKYDRRLIDLIAAKDALLREQQDDVDQLQGDIDINLNMIANIDAEITRLRGSSNVIVQDGTKLKQERDGYNKITTNKSLLVELRTLINQMKSSDARLSDFDTDIKSRTEAYDALLMQCTEANCAVAGVVDAITRVYGSVVTSTELRQRERVLSGAVAKSEAALSMVIAELDHIKAEADALKSGVPCPTCGKPSTEDDIETMRKSLRDKWKSSNTTKKKLTTDSKQHASELSELSESINALEKMEWALQVANDKYRAITDKTNTEKSMLDSVITSKTSYLNTIQTQTTRIAELESYFGKRGLDEIEHELDSQQKEADALDARMNELRGELLVLNNSIASLSNTRAAAQKSTAILQDRLNKRKKAGAGSSLALNESQIETTKVDIQDARMRVKKYSEEIELIKYIDKMYGDEGIKKFVLGIFVPNLNQVVAHNIALFSLPFAIEFDDSLDYKFISKFGMAQVYKGLSQGQQRKLNFCISMAFRDFVTLIADFKINLMFLDEVLDVSTDAEGLRDMIELIKQKSSDIDSIYLMSHRGEDYSDEWAHVIEVNNDGLYSRVGQLY